MVGEQRLVVAGAEDRAGIDRDDAALGARDLLQLGDIGRLDAGRGEIEIDGGLQLRQPLLLVAEPAMRQPRAVIKIKGASEGRGLEARDPTWTAQQIFDHSRRNA